MNCSQWEEAIALYAGGDAQPAEAKAVEEHLAACPACSEFFEQMVRDLQMLAEAHQEPIDAAHFAAVRARVLDQLSQPRSAWWQRSWVYGLAAAAVIIAFLLWPHAAVKPGLPPSRVATVTPAEPPHQAAAPVTIPAAQPKPERRQQVAKLIKRRRANPLPVISLEKKPAEPITVKLMTNDPDVVIYWISDGNGKGE